MASLFYQAATFSRHPVSSLVWIVGSGLVMAGVILGLRLKAIAQEAKGKRGGVFEQKKGARCAPY